MLQGLGDSSLSLWKPLLPHLSPHAPVVSLCLHMLIQSGDPLWSYNQDDWGPTLEPSCSSPDLTRGGQMPLPQPQATE